MKSATAMSNCVRPQGLEWTQLSSFNCVSFAVHDFFEEGGGEPANVVMLLMPLATLATLLDDLFCCIAAANWRIEL